MLKRKARQLKRAAAVSATASRSKRNIVAVVALLLCLSVASGILARWRASHFAARLRPVAATAPTTASGSNPSKEYIYAGEKLVATEEPTPSTARVNYALGINGGVASASSVAGAGFEASAANNGDRKGANWGAGGGWLDAPPQSVFPEWLQIDFNSTKTIDEIDLFSIQDGYNNPIMPTETMTFNLYGLTAFDVQYFNGSAWVNVPGGSISGNNLVWRKLTFSAVITNKIRVLTNASIDGWSRLAEVEAWGGSSSPEVNVALASNGGVASASSSAGSGYVASAANNGDTWGVNWGAGGGWLDAPPQSVFPEWLQIDFNSTKTIHQVDVFMVQDSYAAPVAPTQSMTFTLYGLTDFKVQSWNGTGWTDIPGASATGNNLVWKRFSFPDVSTSKIRLVCTGSVDGWSRVIELQAWGN
ncbi:MAG TPA: discoidin domain-containing protein [Pyrinomonadaceae bacterium]|jgi:hypothetical protein